MILGLTGHRPPKLGGYKVPNPIYNYVYKETVCIFKEFNPDAIISGMALGYDQIGAVIAIRMGIPVIAALPFKGQEKSWPEKSQKTYHKILNKCEEVNIVSDGGYEPKKMYLRNEYIVNNCDTLVACWDGSKSGTGSCIDYAIKVHREYLIINPNNFDG